MRCESWPQDPKSKWLTWASLIEWLNSTSRNSVLSSSRGSWSKANASRHHKESAVVIQAPDCDASCVSPSWGVQSVFHWKETPRQPQSLMEGLGFLSGLGRLRDPLGGAWQCLWGFPSWTCCLHSYTTEEPENGWMDSPGFTLRFSLMKAYCRITITS